MANTRKLMKKKRLKGINNLKDYYLTAKNNSESVASESLHGESFDCWSSRRRRRVSSGDDERSRAIADDAGRRVPSIRQRARLCLPFPSSNLSLSRLSFRTSRASRERR